MHSCSAFQHLAFMLNWFQDMNRIKKPHVCFPSVVDRTRCTLQIVPCETNGGDTQSRNLRKKLAQVFARVSCIKFSCKFIQVQLTTHQIETGVLGRNK